MEDRTADEAEEPLSLGGTASAAGAPDATGCDANPEAVSRRGHATPPPMPMKGKGKGKGKPPPPPAAFSAAAGGAAKSKAAPAALPFGKRLQLKAMATGVDLKDTVFNSMMDCSEASSSDNKAAGLRGNEGASSESDSAFTYSLLREAFGPHPAGEKAARTRRQWAAKTSTAKALLSNQVAQNFSIVLKKLGLPIEELRVVLESLDFDAKLAVEDLERLREIFPSQEQLKPLIEYAGDVSELRDVERQMLTLVSVGRLGPRLHILALKKGLLEKRQQFLEDISCIRSGVTELMQSPLLRDVLEAVLRMFNFINHGVDRLELNTARGFDITTALKVKEFKAMDRAAFAGLEGGSAGSAAAAPVMRFTGLHYVVSHVMKKKPFLRAKDFIAQFSHLARASGLSLSTIFRDANDLLEAADFVTQELSAFRHCYDPEAARETAVPRPAGCNASPSPAAAASQGCASTVGIAAELLQDKSGAAPPSHTPRSPAKEDQPLLSPVPELHSARQHREAQAEAVASPRGMLSRIADSMEAAVRRLAGPQVPADALWLKQVRVPLSGCMSAREGSCGLAARAYTTWRRVAIGAGHVLEVHGRTWVKLVGLPDAVVVPFSDPAASEGARALAAEYPYGFEVGGDDPATRFRFACDCGADLEMWLLMLRAEACAAGVGWLSLKRSAVHMPGNGWNARWCSLDVQRGRLIYHRSVDAAWWLPALPRGAVTLDTTTDGALAVPLEEAPSEVLTGDAESSLQWGFAVRGQRRWYVMAAPSEEAFGRWMQAFDTVPRQRRRDGCARALAVDFGSVADERSSLVDSTAFLAAFPVQVDDVTPRVPSKGAAAVAAADAAEGSSATPMEAAIGSDGQAASRRDLLDIPLLRASSCEWVQEISSPAAATEAAPESTGVCTAEANAVDAAAPIERTTTAVSSSGAEDAKGCGAQPPSLQQVRFDEAALAAIPRPLRSSARPPTARRDDPDDGRRSSAKLAIGRPLAVRGLESSSADDEPTLTPTSGRRRIAKSESSPASSSMSSSSCVESSPAVERSPLCAAAKKPPPLAPIGVPKLDFRLLEDKAEPGCARSEAGTWTCGTGSAADSRMMPALPGNFGALGTRRPSSRPGLGPQPQFLRSFGSGGLPPTSADVSHLTIDEECHSRGDASSSEDSDSETESRADSRAYMAGSSASAQSDMATALHGAQVPTSRLTQVKKLERLKDTTYLAVGEIKIALRQTCEKSSQALRFFGQVAPSIDEELKDLALFSKALQDFLVPVAKFIAEVDATWQEMERLQLLRRRDGLADFADMKTPRVWAPVSARGERRTPRLGTSTPLSSDGFATPRGPLRTPPSKSGTPRSVHRVTPQQSTAATSS
eukprot:TRINITY_DN4594_c0_g1_i1.p1 TRINITY_DN4594_c0_g1~~TRINITY_DN4594_c0_g1_i1.p1  ORF type:complete len:1515 (+),score=420.31 TRINITY_DN4594_c0_g1_i1:479-4546(+)